MTVPKDRTVANHLADPDALTVSRMSAAGSDEMFIALHAGGGVTAFNGHVDLARAFARRWHRLSPRSSAFPSRP